MNPNLASVAAWSYGLAGFGYLAFAAYLGIGWRGGARGQALLVAVGLTAVWALLDLAFALTQAPLLIFVGAVVDVLRIGAWYAFCLALIQRPVAEGAPKDPGRATWLVPVAAALVVAGVLTHVLLAFRVTEFGDPGRLAAFASLSLTIFGLVLVEQPFPQRDRRRAMGRQALVPGSRRGAALRPLPVRGNAVVQPDRRRRVERARFRQCAGPAAVRRVGDAQPRMDVRHSTFASRGLPLDRVDGIGHLPAVHGGRRLLRALLRRQLGCRIAGRRVLCRIASPWRNGTLGLAPREVAGVRQQALLQLPIRLSRRVAALHARAVGARRTDRTGTGRRQGTRRPAGKSRQAVSGSKDAPGRNFVQSHDGTPRPTLRRSRSTASSRASWSTPAGS